MCVLHKHDCAQTSIKWIITILFCPDHQYFGLVCVNSQHPYPNAVLHVKAVKRVTIDPLHDKILAATMHASYAATAAPKTASASKIASTSVQARGSTLFPVAADRQRGPSIHNALPTLATTTVFVLSILCSGRDSSSPVPRTTFVSAPRGRSLFGFVSTVRLCPRSVHPRLGGICP